MVLTVLRPAEIGNSLAKTAGSHVALCGSSLVRSALQTWYKAQKTWQVF